MCDKVVENNGYKNLLFRDFSVSQTVSLDETEDLLTPTHESSMFVGNVSLFLCRKIMMIFILILKILEETKKAQNELREIVQRHEMLINLEKSLQEVYEMFMQISTFVMEQGSLIQVDIHFYE